MSRIISVVNQKGGVGKTTTAINLASGFAEHGKYVLLVDMDPQANATSGIGLNYQELEAGIYDALLGDRQLKDIVRNTAHEGLRIAPSTVHLAGANVELVSVSNREFRLHTVLLEGRHSYDYIIIDCPPSLGLLTLNSIIAADELLIPVQAEYFALEGLGQLLQTVELIKDNLRPEIGILGAVITMYDPRNKLSNDVLEELYKFFPNSIFRTVIPRNVRLAEAPSFGKSIYAYDKYSRGAKAYYRLTREILQYYES